MRTPLCDLLRIDHPILQSGMGRVAGPELVAEVSRAGALGILAGLGLSADELRRQIRRVRELTDRPFGVNLWLHEDLRPPRSPADIPSATLRAAHQVLNRFRQRLELPLASAPPPPYPDVVAEALDAVIGERVPVWSVGLGNPDPSMVDRCHRVGTLVMAMVTTVEDARAVADSGVDLIVAQGGEAGGHRSTWKKPASAAASSVTTMVLVPQVASAVSQPVIAAGGIADGRGVVAALALGAQGALLGTRFVATRESMAPAMYKASLVAASSDDTRVTDTFTGLYARALRNTYLTEYEASGAPVLPPLLQTKAAEDIYAAAARRDDREYFPMWAGQSAGLITDLPPARDVVLAIVNEADAAMARLSDSGKAGRR
jgi:nitronate monooxygenase